MDNRIFNVNGEGDDMLRKTIALAFHQKWESTTAKGFLTTKKHGLIFLWTDGVKGSNMFPVPLGPTSAGQIAIDWLATRPETDMQQWEDDADHDGHNSIGWRVYVEDWGHVNGLWEVICAVKPSFLWHGK